MCGIFGFTGSSDINIRGWADAAIDRLAHRGPDDRGVWLCDQHKAVLGHRRLSILETGNRGHQPYVSPSEQNVLVFNGEIYNFVELRNQLEGLGYRFRSKSDTEVLLASYEQWGRDCLERLNGMFAFAIYDRVQRKLFCARDRIGEKPFYYRRLPRGIVFASEVKALLTDPEFQPRIDDSSLQFYLAFGHTPPESGLIAGVEKLRPGCWLEYQVENDRTETGRYWNLPEAETQRLSTSQLLEELEPLLEDAVQRQLVADVPLGVLLSGGVDSSIITALAVRSGRQVRTYTLASPGSPEHDERQHAELVARHFGTDHHTFAIGLPDVSILDELIKQFDDPMSDSSLLPAYLISREIRKYCKVAVGGDGGDEIFGGYRRYNDHVRLRRMVGWMPIPVRRSIARTVRKFWSDWTRGTGLLRLMESPFPVAASPVTYLAGPGERKKFIGVSAGFGPERLMRKYYDYQPGLQCMLKGDLQTCLPEDYLVKVDRASMLNSLEVRSPLLDYRIVEFAHRRIPNELKVHNGRRKILLKLLGRKVLPEKFDFQRKQGFSVPIADWLRSGIWRERFRDELQSRENVLVCPSAVEKLFDSLDRGFNTSPQLFNLFMLETWCRQYGIST